MEKTIQGERVAQLFDFYESRVREGRLSEEEFAAAMATLAIVTDESDFLEKFVNNEIQDGSTIVSLIIKFGEFMGRGDEAAAAFLGFTD